MGALDDNIREYTFQLNKGIIQKAYKAIINFMSELKAYLESRHPDYNTSSIYFGYMDMTYFAFTPVNLKNNKLKIAIVFLHEECKFEVWLAGNNRKIQGEYIEMLRHKDIGRYTLSQVHPGVDSIIESSILEHPDFGDSFEMKKQIETKVIEFIEDISTIITNEKG